MTSQLKEFTTSAARPLPVILLADVGGSMAAEGKIDALNQSVREMLSTFASTDDLRAEIHVAIVTFGGEARLHTPLQPASAVKWSDMVADGGTPMEIASNTANWVLFQSGQIWGEIYFSTSYAPLLQLKVAPIAVLDSSDR